MADLILKHGTVVDFFYSPAEKMFGKIDTEISPEDLSPED